LRQHEHASTWENKCQRAICQFAFLRLNPNIAVYEKHHTAHYPYLDTNSSKVLASILRNASAIKAGDTYEATLLAKSLVRNMPFFINGGFGFGHCPVEFPSDTDSKRSGWRTFPGDVSRPFFEICSPI
jgi:hypothetical protein